MLWRLARSTYEKSKTVEDATEKRVLVEESYILAKKALELDDKNFAIHKWVAILLNESSKLQGLKEQIKQSFNVKYHMEVESINFLSRWIALKGVFWRGFYEFWDRNLYD